MGDMKESSKKVSAKDKKQPSSDTCYLQIGKQKIRVPNLQGISGCYN